jgi:hypothetical protein
MKKLTFAVLCIALVFGLRPSQASGPVGIYGIVDKVVFEPNEKSPERIQVWGVFAYVDGGANRDLGVSPAKRGYLYFKLPEEGSATEAMARNEWADLKAVAGTGQAIGFGAWGYIGGFSGLQPGSRSSTPPYILEHGARGNVPADVRVRPASEPPRLPAIYQINSGIVKLNAGGSHAAIVEQLKHSK